MTYPSLKHLIASGTLALSLSAAAAPMELDLPRQPLGTALKQLAGLAGVSLAVDDRLLTGQSAPAIKGRYAFSDALQQMLNGSGLAVQEADGVWLIVPRESGDAMELSATTINGLGSVSEHTGSYTTGSMQTATKLPLSIRETPQSVSVVTQQMIKDRHYESLDQALKDTPGVLVRQDSGDNRWEYRARGSIIDTIQYDGLTSSVQTFSRDVVPDDDLTMYDRVEVVRGATGLLTGAGNPSASVNLIRKHGTATPRRR